jgi:hypothetical protein
MSLLTKAVVCSWSSDELCDWLSKECGIARNKLAISERDNIDPKVLIDVKLT